jgi:hypothetical protein
MVPPATRVAQVVLRLYPDPTALETNDRLYDHTQAAARTIEATALIAIENRDLERPAPARKAMWDLAKVASTLRSYELFAEEVMPRFTGRLDPVLRSYGHVLGETQANRSSAAAARAAAEQQWRREREASGTQ